MTINIQELFSGILSPAQATGRPQTRPAANMIGQLGAIADAGQGNVSDALRGGVGRLFGADMSTSSERLKQGLQGIDVTTPAGEDKAFQLISAVDPTKAIAFRAAMAEQRQQQQKADADTLRSEAVSTEASFAGDRAAAATLVAETGAANAETNAILAQAQTDNVARAVAHDAWEVTDNEALREIQDKQNDIAEFDSATKRLIAENNKDSLSVAAQGVINTKVDAAIEARGKAREANRIAQTYAVINPRPGWFGTAETAFRDFLGTQGDAELLRRDFNRLVNANVMESLPPGPASDVDVAMAQRGFPSDVYNSDMIQQYLRGVAKASAINAEFEDARATWVSDHKGNSAGFIADWDEKIADPGFAKMVEDKYGLEWHPETAEQVETREALAAGVKPPWQMAQEEQQRRQQTSGIRGRGANR